MEHTVLVVGGGAGGLPLVTLLGRRLGKSGKAKIVLVDNAGSHVWKPRFHEVATGAIDGDLDAVDFRAHARLNHYRFEPGALQSVNRESRTITLAPVTDETGEVMLPARQLAYDTLVLAIGSQSNDFGTPGVRDNCYFLDRRDQVERFRERFLNLCLKADYRDSPLRVAIVGAGATGVELAAEIHHAVAMLHLYGHDHLDRSRLQVDILEAAPRILPGLPERISTAASKRLSGLGVTIHTGSAVKSAEPGAFIVGEDERLEADLLVWAAGVKASGLLTEIDGLTTNRINQIEVNASLQAKGDENIFVMGDCACLIPEGAERPIPPRAQAAQQMAKFLAKQIPKRMEGRSLDNFEYRDQGSLVSLSNYSSVGHLMGNLKGGNFFIEGWLARMMYVGLYRMHQAVLFGWARTIMLLLAGRFGRMVRPRLKLH